MEPSVHLQSAKQPVLAPEYQSCWDSCVIQPKWQQHAFEAAITAVKNKDRYEQVEASIGVPWYVVAAIHYREASFDFTTCLHNGDSLPGPTIHEPKGRGPFGTWADAAVDALKFDGLNLVTKWDIPTIFWNLEAYNGMGYRLNHYIDVTPYGASPYIYSGSQFYQIGKYASDGVFKGTLRDDQLGCMALLKQLQSMKEITL